MLAYAANRRSLARHTPSPQAMLAIAVAHVALIAAVMSARTDLPQKLTRTVTEVELIELPAPPPPPPPPEPRTQHRPSPSVIDRPPVVLPIPQPSLPSLDIRPVPVPADPVVGPAIVPEPRVVPQPSSPVRIGPRFATPDHALRPPYPPSKLASGEEASLRLRLAIDERGRVIAVEPVGRADPAFLAAARRHLVAKWRYRPATEDGRAVAATTLITLRFELD